VMHRPGCAEAVGRTCLDLLRLAPEVTALQDAPSPVAILYSVASIVGGEEYLDELDRAYEALNFTGVKINFISEKQIQEGGLVRYSLLVIPAAGRVMDATFEGIRRFALGGGRIVATGDALGADEYGRRRSAGDVDGVLQRAARLEAGLSGRALWLHLLEALSEAGAPEVECVEAASGQPAWGVEWLSVRDGGSLLINAVNLTKRKIAVRFRARGGELWSFGHYRRVPKTPPDEVLQVRVAGRDSSANGKTSIGGLTDLLSGRGRRQPITLEPLKPVLVRARRP
jgi:hypothetical protein